MADFTSILISFIAGMLAIVFLSHYKPTSSFVAKVLGNSKSSSSSSSSSSTSSANATQPRRAFGSDFSHFPTPTKTSSTPTSTTTPTTTSSTTAPTTTPSTTSSSSTVASTTTSTPSSTTTSPNSSTTNVVSSATPTSSTTIVPQHPIQSSSNLSTSNPTVIATPAPITATSGLSSGSSSGKTSFLGSLAMSGKRSPGQTRKLEQSLDLAAKNSSSQPQPHATSSLSTGTHRRTLSNVSPRSPKNDSDSDDDIESDSSWGSDSNLLEARKQGIVFQGAVEVKLPSDSIFGIKPMGFHERWIPKFAVLRSIGVLSIFEDSSRSVCSLVVVLNGCEIANKIHYGKRWKIKAKSKSIPIVRSGVTNCPDHADPHNDTLGELNNNPFIIIRTDHRSQKKKWLKELKEIVKVIPEQAPEVEKPVINKPHDRLYLSARVASMSAGLKLSGRPLLIPESEIVKIIEKPVEEVKPTHVVPVTSAPPAIIQVTPPTEMTPFEAPEQREAMIRGIVESMKQINIRGEAGDSMRQEATTTICNFLFPIVGPGYRLVRLEGREGFKLEIGISNSPRADIPANSRIPYHVTINPKTSNLVTFTVSTQPRAGSQSQDELVVDVDEQIQLHRVSDDEIEKIVETMPNVPLVNLRGHARKNLLLSDESIFYREFIYFPGPMDPLDVRVRSTREPLSEEAKKRIQGIKSNLDKLRNYEMFARSALNYGLMMLYPEEGGKANLINVLFGPKLSPEDPQGRLSWTI